MHLFRPPDDAAPEPDQTLNLVWRYEISDDDGENWRLERELEPRNPAGLRRGCWVAPPLN